MYMLTTEINAKDPNSHIYFIRITSFISDNSLTQQLETIIIKKRDKTEITDKNVSFKKVKVSEIQLVHDF